MGRASVAGELVKRLPQLEQHFPHPPKPSAAKWGFALLGCGGDGFAVLGLPRGQAVRWPEDEGSRRTRVERAEAEFVPAFRISQRPLNARPLWAGPTCQLIVLIFRGCFSKAE